MKVINTVSFGIKCNVYDSEFFNVEVLKKCCGFGVLKLDCWFD